MQVTTPILSKPEVSFNQTYDEAIKNRQAMINTLERLCMQVGKTLLCLAKSVNEPKENKTKTYRGFHAFVRENTLGEDREDEKNDAHFTTTAQCISALQAIVRILDSIKQHTPESSNLLFQTLPAQMGKPSELRKELSDMLESQLEQLAIDKEDVVLKKSSFGELNPFTCAHVFSALVPSKHLYEKNCWVSLFGVLWALRRHHPNYERETGVAMKNSLPTVFVTSLCISAIESLIELFKRRQKRWMDLIALIKELQDEEKKTKEANIKEKGENFVRQIEPLTRHKCTFLVHRIIECLTEHTHDAAALRLLSEAWKKDLEEKLQDGGELQNNFSKSVFESFENAIGDSKVKEELEGLDNKKKDVENSKTKYFERYFDFKKYYKEKHLPIPDSQSNTHRPPLDKEENLLDFLNADTLKSFQYKNDGFVDDMFCREFNGNNPVPGNDKVDEALKKYWRDQYQAMNSADETSRDILKYLIEFSTKTAKSTKNGSDGFVKLLEDSKQGIEEKIQKLHEYIAAPIHWAESVMEHQLSLARGGSLGEFDVGALAHATRIVTLTGHTHNAAPILEAVKVVCDNQYPDGKWPCTQPFFWTDSGLAIYPHSGEVAWALVSIMRNLITNHEVFGLTQEEVLAVSEEVNRALERFINWLGANARNYEKLKPLNGSQDKSEKHLVFGWSSDRIPEPGVVHTWATANIAEFLIEFRTCLQEQINTLLRVHFSSYAPKVFNSLKKFAPPDLEHSKYEERVDTRIWDELKLHHRQALREMYWVPNAAYEEKAEMFSAILAGPPGSAKTYLAQSIAGELEWPFISLTPSDFLAAGEAEVEARIHTIFKALEAGSRLVYFFDEIDELILDRASQNKESRNVFSFLTPSFLTKLQDLRNAASHKSLIFLIGTNYLDHIDSAAKRSGRIDETLLVMYPDKPSRAGMVANLIDSNIEEEFGKVANQDEKVKALYEKLDKLVDATALLSVPGLKKLCTKIVKQIKRESLEKGKEWLEEEIEALNAGKSALIKPEVNLLAFYGGRPGAVEEWIKMMDLKFPKGQDDNSNKQVTGYIDSLTSNYTVWKLHKQQINDVFEVLEQEEHPWYNKDNVRAYIKKK